jgi:hypothetical protein
LDRLSWFTDTLVEQLQPFDKALLIVDQIVFEVPPALERLRLAVGEQRLVREAPGCSFEGDREGFRSVLEAALSGWIDLRAIFSPASHALRADHDEYTTIFSQSPSTLADTCRKLSEAGVLIVDFTAPAP